MKNNIPEATLNMLKNRKHWGSESKFNPEGGSIFEAPRVLRDIIYKNLKGLISDIDDLEKGCSYESQMEPGLVCYFKPYENYYIFVSIPVYDIDKQKESDEPMVLCFNVNHQDIDQLLIEVIDKDE